MRTATLRLPLPSRQSLFPAETDTKHLIHLTILLILQPSAVRPSMPILTSLVVKLRGRIRGLTDRRDTAVQRPTLRPLDLVTSHTPPKQRLNSMGIGKESLTPHRHARTHAHTHTVQSLRGSPCAKNVREVSLHFHELDHMA